MKTDKKFKGVITPVVTPLNEDYSLDRDSYKVLINHLIDGGVHGLFILGTTGEGPHLSHTMRKEVIDVTVELNANRLPILVGITDTSIDELLDLADYAYHKSIDAVVMAAPFYTPISQTELKYWFEHVAPQIKLPIILYDLPSHINVKISVELVKDLSNIENIIGIKDSSGDMTYFNLLLNAIERSDFGFYTGPEILFSESLLAGGDGGVPGGSNLYPKLFVDIYQSAIEQELGILRSRQNVVRKLYNGLYKLEPSGSGFMYGLHAGLAIKGICKNIMYPPYIGLDEKQLKTANQLIQTLEEEFPFIA